MNRHKLLEAIAVMGRTTGSDDRALAAELVSAGFTTRDAEVLVALVPLALSRPILEQLGVSHFVDTISAKNKADEWIQFPLTSQRIYVTALGLAREQWRGAGVIDKEVYKNLAQRCSTIDAVSNLLNAGASAKGATVATALASLKAEDLHPAPWIIRLLRVVGV